MILVGTGYYNEVWPGPALFNLACNRNPCPYYRIVDYCLEQLLQRLNWPNESLPMEK